MIGAVLLDLDGTLILSNDAHARAYADAFAEWGFHPPLEEIRRAIGLGSKHLLPNFLPADVIERDGKALLARREEILKERYVPEIRPVLGARAFVEALKDRGLKVVLGTSATEEELAWLRPIAGISDLIVGETNADEVKESKPAPDVWIEAAKLAGVPPDQCAAVGDTPYDAQAARAAGVAAIGVETGGWSREELLDAGFAEVYADVRELMVGLDESLIGRMPTGEAW